MFLIARYYILTDGRLEGTCNFFACGSHNYLLLSNYYGVPHIDNLKQKKRYLRKENRDVGMEI